MKNLECSLKITIGPLSHGSLGVVGGGGDMLDPPSETQILEHPTTKNPGIVSDLRRVCHMQVRASLPDIHIPLALYYCERPEKTQISKKRQESPGSQCSHVSYG